MPYALLALGDPTRIRIVELLRTANLEAGQIAAEFDTSRPGISRHLRVLREYDVVRVRAEGQRRIYSLNPASFQELDDWLAPYRQFWANRLDALEAQIKRRKRSKR